MSRPLRPTRRSDTPGSEVDRRSGLAEEGRHRRDPPGRSSRDPVKRRAPPLKRSRCWPGRSPSPRQPRDRSRRARIGAIAWRRLAGRHPVRVAGGAIGGEADGRRRVARPPGRSRHGASGRSTSRPSGSSRPRPRRSRRPGPRSLPMRRSARAPAEFVRPERTARGTDRRIFSTTAAASDPPSSPWSTNTQAPPGDPARSDTSPVTAIADDEDGEEAIERRVRHGPSVVSPVAAQRQARASPVSERRQEVAEEGFAGRRLEARRSERFVEAEDGRHVVVCRASSGRRCGGSPPARLQRSRRRSPGDYPSALNGFLPATRISPSIATRPSSISRRIFGHSRSNVALIRSLPSDAPNAERR